MVSRDGNFAVVAVTIFNVAFRIIHRVQRGNKIIRYLCVLIGILGGAISGYMLTQEKSIRKVVEPVENKVQVIGQAISEMEGKKDSPMAYAGSRY